MPSIPLPTRVRPPLPWVGKDVKRSYHGRDHRYENDTVAAGPRLTTRSNSSSSSSASTSSKSRVSSTSSPEPLESPPARSRAQDSMSSKTTQDSRLYNLMSSGEKRLKAASHDLTGIEQAMASSETFRPHRPTPVIPQNDSVYPALPMAGFTLGTERPYSPHRLRPWLTNNNHNNFLNITSVNTI